MFAPNIEILEHESHTHNNFFYDFINFFFAGKI